MSLEKIIAEAIEGNPLNLKEQFEEEMRSRVAAALEEKYKTAGGITEEDEDDADEDEDEDEDDDDDMDEAACVKEMKKLHASACSKTEMYEKCNEKFGCTKETFNKLYAQYCK